MSDKYRIPDYKKIYPEASDEVIAVLRHTERKMQYQEYDLKTGDYEINQKEETVTYFFQQGRLIGTSVGDRTSI